MSDVISIDSLLALCALGRRNLPRGGNREANVLMQRGYPDIVAVRVAFTTPFTVSQPADVDPDARPGRDLALALMARFDKAIRMIAAEFVRSRQP